MTRLSLIAAACFSLVGCTTSEGQPFARIEPVTADDPPAEVHLAAPAIAAEQGPMSF